jgi:regulator of protease activity HflC (stomatin/prohibitin superfamily)
MVVGAETFLQAVVANIASLFPVRIIHSYEQGVKFSRGIDRKLLQPGFHFFIPGYQSIHAESVVPQTINLPTQSFITRDNYDVSVSSNLEYQVVDVRKMWTGVQNLSTSINNTGMGYLSRYGRDNTFSELCKDTSELENKITEALNTKLEPWGTKINEFYITDVSRTIGLRHYSDSSTLLKSIE